MRDRESMAAWPTAPRRSNHVRRLRLRDRNPAPGRGSRDRRFGTRRAAQHVGWFAAVQRRNAELYARALMEAGARKSLEPMVARLGGGSVEYEALHHFIADSPWDAEVIDRAVAERVCAVIEPAAWVLDDTGIPKDGQRSPGVKRQYAG